MINKQKYHAPLYATTLLCFLLTACSSVPPSASYNNSPSATTPALALPAGLNPTAQPTITYSTSFATNPLPAPLSHSIISKLAQDSGFAFHGTVPPLNHMHFQNTTAENILQQLANSSGQIAIIDPSSSTVKFAPSASLHLYIPTTLPHTPHLTQLQASSIPTTATAQASRTHLTITGNYRQLASALAQTRQLFGANSTHIEVQLTQ